jgi:hypothetical protein
MSIGPTLTLKDTASADHTFASLYNDKNESRYYDTAIAKPEKDHLLVRQQPTGSGSSKGTRTTVTREIARLDAAGVLISGAVNLSINQPSNGVITVAMIKSALFEMIHLLSSAAPTSLHASRVDAILNGES